MKKLLLAERFALAWAVITTVLVVALWHHIADPLQLLQTRLLWLTMTALVAGIGFRLPGRVTTLARCAVQLVWLSVWYPETYELNCWRDNLDWVFASADWHLFGCQPSLEMSQWLSSGVWSELFNLGYFSYFPTIGLLILSVFAAEYMARNSELKASASPFQLTASRGATETPTSQVTALVLMAFFIYYAIYIAVPVAGPQFYFAATGTEQAAEGIYPHLGPYFYSHTDILPAPGWSDGVFYKLVAAAQAKGERPTAAFPSSHIGMSTIVLTLAWRRVRRLVPVIAPLWLLLCGATVYIQAHYLVDAVAGLLTAPLALWLSERIYVLSGGVLAATPRRG